MTSYRLMDGVSGRPGTGSSGTQPPSSSTASGSDVLSTMFTVTAGMIFLEGYWFYRADNAQASTAQTFCLWSPAWDVSTANGYLVPGSAITSGPLNVGWNYVPYATPIPLSQGMPYRAQTGITGRIPLTANQFGTGNPYAAGIVNGPLSGYSDTTGSLPSPGFAQRQGGYNLNSADPTLVYAGTGNPGGDNYWVDIQVTDTVPASVTSYRLWPNVSYGSQLRTDDSNGYTIGTEFYVTSPCKLMAIWWFSPPGAASLPSRCLLWDAVAQTAIPGTDNAAPSWVNVAGGAASPGDGQIKVDYSSASVILTAGKRYITSVFHAALGDHWFADSPGFWAAGSGLQAGVNGLTRGPLVAPGNAGATIGQSIEHLTTFAFPGTSDLGANDWTDVEVAPSANYAVEAFTATLGGADIFVDAGARKDIVADASVIALWPGNFTVTAPVAGVGDITGVHAGYLAAYPDGPQV